MRESKSDMQRGATVVVPTLNRGGFLEPCLRDLLAQTYRPLEILVVDQSDTVPESTRSLATANPDIITHHQVDFRGLPRARNYGWQYARYERIIFVDDDIRCGPDLVAEHVRALGLPHVGAVAGGIDEANKQEAPGGHTGRFNRWTATATRAFCETGSGEVDHGPGGNFSLWREVIRKAGGVDEALNVGAALYEETDLFLRIKAAGYRVWFTGAARLTHLAAPSGGCRVDQVEPYVYSLARNRTVLIRRYLRAYHRPTAFGRLALLAASYARAYRQPRALAAGLRGVVAGWRAGGRKPVCTRALERVEA